jgi:multidrug efflux pump subunit AcrA (membrane-fusion protein)
MNASLARQRNVSARAIAARRRVLSGISAVGRPNPILSVFLFAGLATLTFAGCGTALPGSTPAKAQQPEVPAAEKSEPKKAGEKFATAEAGEHEKPTAGKEVAQESDSEKDKEKEDKEKEKEGDKVAAHVNVRGVPCRKRTVEVTVDGLGRTEPLPEKLGSLTATVEGHVDKLLAHVGDVVTAGQPILELDTAIIRTSLREKLASRASLKAAMVLLVSPPRPEECQADELGIEQAKVGISRASALVESLQTLASKQEISQQQLFDAREALKAARLQRETAEAQLKLLKLGPRPEAVAESRTKIAIADEAVANIRAMLELHTLRAPIAGVVDSLTCHPGQTLTVGTAVGEIVDTQQVVVTVYFPARSARHVQAGLPVRIDLPEAENRQAAKADAMFGRVAFVGRVADAQTGNFPTRILVENSASRLRVGQVVKATITIGKAESAIVVPEAAIFDQGEGPLLAVVREGKLKLLHPELGPAEGGFVTVTKTDLREGELVVTEGAYNVPEGTSATVEPSPAPVHATTGAKEHE